MVLWLQAAYVSYYAYKRELWERWRKGLQLMRGSRRVGCLRAHAQSPEEIDTEVAEQLHDEIEAAEEADRVDVGEYLLLKHDRDGRGLYTGEQVSTWTAATSVLP